MLVKFNWKYCFWQFIQAFKIRYHIRTGSLPLEDKDEEKYDYRLSCLFIIPNGKLPMHANVMTNLLSLNNLPNTRV